MPELRWILLGLGILFFLGLWWWEARRGRQASGSSASLNPVDSFTSTSTTVVRDAASRADAESPAARELPPWDEPADAAGDMPPWDEPARAARELTPGDEPVRAARELPPWDEPADEEEDKDEDDELDGQPETAVEFDMPPEDLSPQPMTDIAALPRPARHAQPERIEPTIGDAAAAVGGAARQHSEAPAVQERIVTLRVAAPPLERFEGRRLVAALRTAGLEYGKFSIFHKITAEGMTLFSVASLVEPGTFDLDAIEGRRFPGVSLFAVLRSDADTAAFDDMLGTARGLAGNLHGTVQDERGAPLSPQKLADLRAEITGWQRSAQPGS